MQSNAEVDLGCEVHTDTSEAVTPGEGAGIKHSLRRRLIIVAAGVCLGIAARVIYLFFMVMLPVPDSGAAVLGERFSSGW